jgi:hypothetical protein
MSLNQSPLPQDHADSTVNTLQLNGTQEATNSTYVLQKDMNGDVMTGIGIVSLTATQIKNLYGTPLTLVSAAGSGKVILVDSACLSIVTGTCPFGSGGVITIGLGAAGAGAVTGTMNSGAVCATASTTTITTVVGAGATLTGYDNTPLVITNATQAFIKGGTSTGQLTFKYRIVQANA